MTNRPHLLIAIQRINLKLFYSRRAGIILPAAVLLLAVLACNFPKFRAPEKASQVASPPEFESSDLRPSEEENPLTLAASATDLSQEKLLLHWHGSLPGDPSPCLDLEVLDNHQARYGPCDGEMQAAPFNPPQWDEMLTHHAPFEIHTPEVEITFQGQGNTGGPAWEGAVVHWAQTAYATLSTGRACAACNTVLNWSFGEEPGASQSGSCLDLWVTNYGYAYLGEAPCQGGQAAIKARGWLETGELAELDAWITARSEVRLGETGASYLLGQGSQAMSGDEITQLAAWAQAVRRRLEQ